MFRKPFYFMQSKRKKYSTERTDFTTDPKKLNEEIDAAAFMNLK